MLEQSALYADLPVDLISPILSEPLPNTAENRSSQTRAKTTTAHTRTLIVDDHQETLLSLAAFLKGVGFEPIAADHRNPVASTHLLWNSDPTLRIAIAHLKMPDENGVETVEAGFSLIGELRKRPGSVVVVHSGFTDPALRKRAESLGCVGFFSKDIDPSQFVDRLQRVAAAQAEWLAEEQHTADRNWFLSNPAMWADRQDHIVAVFNREILGQGPDFVEAYQDAQRRCTEQSKPCPNKYDIAFVIVPDVVHAEPAHRLGHDGTRHCLIECLPRLPSPDCTQGSPDEPFTGPHGLANPTLRQRPCSEARRRRARGWMPNLPI